MARSTCPRTGKAQFPDRLECELALADIALNSKHHRRQKSREEPVRAYRCEFCSKWHQTSQAERESQIAS